MEGSQTILNLPTVLADSYQLRPFLPGDEYALQANLNDRKVARDVTNIPFPYNLSHARKWVEQCSTVVSNGSDRVDFAIVTDENVVGSVAFIHYDHQNLSAQVSYWLSPKYWGKGIVTDAVKKLVKFGFTELGLERIYGYVYTENEASARVLQKAGFSYEGCLRRTWRKQIDGVIKHFDSNYYAILSDLPHAKLQSVAIVTPPEESYELAARTADLLKDSFEAYGLTVCEEPEHAQSDLAIAIGGDGTVMKNVRRFSALGVPTIGVNAGDVGFLTSIEASDWWYLVDLVLENQYRVERRLSLRLTIESEQGKRSFGPFANEIVLKHPNSVASFTLSINDEVYYESVMADGFLISTATGSTAYNTAVGGPIILPMSKSVVVSPINPMVLNTRPIVLDEVANGGNVKLTIASSKRDLPVQLKADEVSFGQSDGLSAGGLEVGDSITITRHPRSLLFATLGSSQYAEALRNKKGFAR